MTSDVLLSLLNWCVCMAIGVTSICRITQPACNENRLIRLRYVLLLTGAFVSGWQPLWFETAPTVGTVVFTGCVASTLAVDFFRFRLGGGKGACPMY